MQESLGLPPTFDPTASQHRVRIAVSKYELASLAPPFLAQAEEEAVQMRVFGFLLRCDESLAHFSDGTIDLVFGFSWDVGSEFVTVPLHQVNYEVMMRRGRMLTGRLTSPRALAEARYLLVKPDGGQRGLMGEALASERLTRRVVSDIVSCPPSRIVALFARRFNLQHQALPF